MSKPTCTHSACDIEDDVVGTIRVSGNAADSLKMIEAQIIANPPPDVMIRAGSIAAHAHGTHDLLGGSVQSETAAKNVHAADFFTHHRIVGLAETGRGPLVGNVRVHGITLLEPEKATARLHRRIQIRSRQRQSVRKL